MNPINPNDGGGAGDWNLCHICGRSCYAIEYIHTTGGPTNAHARLCASCNAYEDNSQMVQVGTAELNFLSTRQWVKHMRYVAKNVPFEERSLEVNLSAHRPESTNVQNDFVQYYSNSNNGKVADLSLLELRSTLAALKTISMDASQDDAKYLIQKTLDLSKFSNGGPGSKAFNEIKDKLETETGDANKGYDYGTNYRLDWNVLGDNAWKCLYIQLTYDLFVNKLSHNLWDMIVHFLKSGENTRSASFLHTKADANYNFFKGVLLMFGDAAQGTPLHLDWTTAVNLAISVISPDNTLMVVGKCSKLEL